MTTDEEKSGLGAADLNATASTYVPDRNPEEAVGGIPDGEVEGRDRVDKLKKDYGSTWDGPDDPNDPYNWSSWRKVSIGFIFSFGQLVTIASASMIAASLGDIERDLGVDPSTGQIIFSTYFLGLAFGPFLIAAWAEMSGRKQVWLFANAWFIMWNALCPVGTSKGLMIAGRLMAGFGGSAGVTLNGPVMADMYGAEERGKSLAIASALTYLGPALGPIIGGLVTRSLAWPWIFWVICIINAGITLVGLFFIRESYTPVLLRRKAQRENSDSTTALSPMNWPYWHDFLLRLSGNLARPILLLVQRPVIQVMALLLGLDFGIYTILLSTFAELYMDRYGQSKTISSLHYISISIGSTISAQVGGRIMDAIYRRLKNRSPDKQGRPEFRIPWLVPGVIILPAGLFWYGWSAERGISWVMVDVGAALFTLGSWVFSQALLAYMLDEFAEFGASANAATRVFSYVLGFAFPIFAPQLYEKLGYGWGNSLLGFVWIALVGPVPLLLWLWGDKLRALGRKD